MNCLAYALRFWKQNPRYRIYYDSNHCINVHGRLTHEPELKREWGLEKEGSFCHFLPIEYYGLQYFESAFAGLLSEDEMALLKEYFK